MGREWEPGRAVTPFECGMEFGASLLEVRYSCFVLEELRWCAWGDEGSGVRGLRALVGVRGREGGRKRPRHETVTCPYASKRPMYDPQTGYFVHPEHLLIPEPQPPPTSDPPAPNRLPNGAVYDHSSLTPLMLSVLCGGRRGVWEYMLIEQHAPVFVFARAWGCLVSRPGLVCGEGAQGCFIPYYVHLRGSERSSR